MSARGENAPRRRLPVRLLLFGAAAVASFGLGFLVFGVGRSRILVQHYGYYTMALTFAWAVHAAVRVCRSSGRKGAGIPRRDWVQAGAIVLGCSLVAVLTVPLNYKVLYDEMVVQATASNLHLYREVSTVMRAYTVDGVFAPFDSYVDKRPFFFPFLVSLVHDLTGYREANAFAVNIALMPVVLTALYAVARRFAGHGAAVAGVVSLGCLSTLAHSATSSGLETLNVAMLLLAMLVAISYLQAPDERRLALLVLVTVLLAQTRYESSLFVGPVALVAFEGWRRARRIILPNAALAAPLLLVPYALHNTYLSGTPMLWELHEAQERFGLEYLGTNLVHAGRFLFNVSGNLTNSAWLSAAGLAGLGYAASYAWRGRGKWREATPAAIVLVAYGLGIAANLALLMFYYWGRLDDPTVARLSLPFAALLALAIAFTVGRLDAPGRHLSGVAAGGAMLAFFSSGLVANAQHTRLNTLGREIEWERDFVAALPPGERLVITNKSSLPWILGRTSSIAIERARRRVDALRHQLVDHAFREILVCQSYRPTGAAGDFQLTPADRLPDWFVLEPLVERRFGTRLDRLSRLVEIREQAPAAAERAAAAPAGGKPGGTAASSALATQP